MQCLGLKKEAYQKIGFNLKETSQILTFPGLYRMGLKKISGKLSVNTIVHLVKKHL